MRKQIVAGNWKMNKSFEEAEDLIIAISERLQEIEYDDSNKVVILCPPFPFLEMATDEASESVFAVGAQNVSQFDNGAYTGEISAKMLDSLGLEYCIVGHSERRKYFNETNAVLSQKVDKLLEKEISPIYCCGETIEERNSGKHFDVVRTQIEEGLFGLNEDDILSVVIAYEPVWAIGTGLTATTQQAQEMHAFIRTLLTKKYGEQIASEISILYGGSCNPKNAAELFAQEDVDGGLIGGASLKSDDFIEIILSL